MRREILEIPETVGCLLSEGRADIIRAASALRNHDPDLVLTVARGSSDHAATFLKYACELMLGIPVASVGPSTASIYGARLRLRRAACIAVSQSGQSPDIVVTARAATESGALSVAVTNAPGSPLAGVCRHEVPLCAGPELSVAATKTFVASLVSGLLLLAHWKGDGNLVRHLEALPTQLSDAVSQHWPELRAAIRRSSGLFVLGRGPCFAVSNEAALKLKETCGIHAESYSSAEVLHGPVEIIGQDFPVVALVAGDAAEPSIADTCDLLSQRGGRVFATTGRAGSATRLPSVRTGHPLTDPIAVIASFYACVERLARERGHNPDTPRNLTKVTETI